MSDVTTVQLDKATVKALKEVRQYPRETYNELITRLINLAKAKGNYDEFLHKVQQEKMRELWDNKEDEAWENA